MGEANIQPPSTGALAACSIKNPQGENGLGNHDESLVLRLHNCTKYNDPKPIRD
jgi:hypothetical protein